MWSSGFSPPELPICRTLRIHLSDDEAARPLPAHTGARDYTPQPNAPPLRCSLRASARQTSQSAPRSESTPRTTKPHALSQRKRAKARDYTPQPNAPPLRCSLRASARQTSQSAQRSESTPRTTKPHALSQRTRAKARDYTPQPNAPPLRRSLRASARPNLAIRPTLGIYCIA